MRIVPELLVTDLGASLRFWCGLCGFGVAFDRPEEGFACLEREGGRVMLEELGRGGRYWITGALEAPLGRGINLEIEVDALDPIVAALRGAGWPLFMEPEETWYRAGAREVGVRQALVEDPDGYLLRLQQKIGERPGGMGPA